MLWWSSISYTLHTNGGCGKREAHINWSMVTCKKAAPVVTGTTSVVANLLGKAASNDKNDAFNFLGNNLGYSSKHNIVSLCHFTRKQD